MQAISGGFWDGYDTIWYHIYIYNMIPIVLPIIIPIYHRSRRLSNLQEQAAAKAEKAAKAAEVPMKSDENWGGYLSEWIWPNYSFPVFPTIINNDWHRQLYLTLYQVLQLICRQLCTQLSFLCATNPGESQVSRDFAQCLSWIQAEQQPLIHVHPDVFETHRDARMLSEIAHAAATAIEMEKEQRPPPKAWKRGWKRWKNVKECENMWQNEQNELEITWKVFRMGHLI